MEEIIDFIKLIIPAGIVLYAMYLTVNSFLKKELEKIQVSDRAKLKAKNRDIVLPLRLQAYERIILLLERISPNHLIPRLNNNTLGAAQFQQLLLHEVREEFNHNLAQQIYLSEEAWDLTKNAVEDLIGIINSAAAQLNDEASSLDLAKVIFGTVMEKNLDSITVASRFIKKEIREFY